MLDNVPSQQLPDICVSIVKASLAEKVQVLDAVDLAERFKKTLPLLMRQIEVITQIFLMSYGVQTALLRHKIGVTMLLPHMRSNILHFVPTS